VLLTGHTGFKGVWLAFWLTRLGAEITGYALAPDTTPSLAVLSGVETRLHAVRGDIRDGAALAAAMARARPDIVLHLAAQSLVRRSYADPVTTFETNVLGTVQVMQAARNTASVAAVVVVSSDKCYENDESGHAHTETDRLGGHDPYSASKACAELAVAAWRQSFATGPRIATARAGNVIGGGDWAADRLVPDCIRAFTAGEPARVRHPRATRPWQHVLEPLCGYLLLAENLCGATAADDATAWNFGPDRAEARPVAQVVSRLAAAWGAGAGWLEDSHDQQHEATLLAVDASRARARLGWRPRLDLDTAIAWTARWYREADHGADAAALIEADLALYHQA
jgi:CDP-glucose 4,6-dehydratase